MNPLEKPVKDLTPADKAALAKPFAMTGKSFPFAAGIAPQEDDRPLVLYTTLSGCSPA
jgi:hypothetical protein